MYPVRVYVVLKGETQQRQYLATSVKVDEHDWIARHGVQIVAKFRRNQIVWWLQEPVPEHELHPGGASLGFLARVFLSIRRFFMKIFGFLMLLAGALQAQNSYSVSKTTTLAGAAEVITVQGGTPANVKLVRAVYFKAFDVTSSVACTVTLERDGTAASSTALDIAPLNNNMPASQAVAFSNSNVGTGTVLAQYSVPAGGQIAVALTNKQLYFGKDNLTLRISSITGTVNINLQWDEK